MKAVFLKRIALGLEKKQNSIFTYPVAVQKKYIKHFPEPKDNIERAYFQYCCQMKLYGELIQTCLNLSALPISLLYLLKLKKTDEETKKSVDAVFFNDGKPFNIIPKSVVLKYQDIITLSTDNRILTKDDRAFLNRIFKRYPFSWMFWLKLVLNISRYSYAIIKYSPKAIISCSEFSFTSSVLTEYCHTKGVKLINVMHGEKLYFIRDSFVKYDEFYVWDKGYRDLLASLGADKEQFKIEAPASLTIKADYEVEKKYDYTYYLQIEPDSELEKLSQTLGKLVDKGYKVSLRPHPRYTNIDTVNRLFSGIDIEDCNMLSIEKSILETKNVISKYSSVLNQAYHSGINIVIDDISDKNRFLKLKELQFVMLTVEHKLLSDVLEEKDVVSYTL